MQNEGVQEKVKSFTTPEKIKGVTQPIFSVTLSYLRPMRNFMQPKSACSKHVSVICVYHLEFGNNYQTAFHGLLYAILSN